MINITDILDMTGVVVTQEFGVPWVRNDREFHNGIDLSATKFTPLKIPVDGVITRASYHFSDPIHAFGNRVSIYFKADNRALELYLCHLDGLQNALCGDFIRDGYPRVKSGQIAGWVGSTGSCVGNNGGVHLHLGVRDYHTGEWLNPREFINFG